MTKKLTDLLLFTIPVQTVGTIDWEISGVTSDSRKVTESCIFVAIKGFSSDGHSYISQAIEGGARVVVCEKLSDVVVENVTYLVVTDSAAAFGHISCSFYDFPSQKLQLVGVTGTNGKTTTCTLLYDLFTELGYKCGLISTIENRILKQKVVSTHTTPDAAGLNFLLNEMVEAECSFVFMEVSSHAIHQQRIAGIRFAGGIFSNISHDHLDYHKTFAEYISVKKKFFDDLPTTAFALSNIDDKRGEIMLQNTAAKKFTYSLKRDANFKAKVIENSLDGLHFEINNCEIYARLIGIFNIYNLTAAFAASQILGADSSETLRILSKLQAAEGRFEVIFNRQNTIYGIVDYAHTPDALENVLQTIREVQKGGGNIITIIGCGGNRDRAKRPLMAKIASNYSHQVIFTSDNPRNENPDEIIREMESGVPLDEKYKVLSIENRQQAIKVATRLARHGDVILVAGKGHEKYQIIKNQVFPFDDKLVLEEEFKEI